MGWIKLDDTLPDNTKIERAGDHASWLYVCGLLYCSRAMSDGFIPENRVPRLTRLRQPKQLADKLVTVGLWERIEDGYLVPDYLEHQRSAEQVKRDREQARRRQERSRHARNNGVSHAVTNGEVTVAEESREEERF